MARLFRRTTSASPVPEELEDHDRGLDHDLPRILDRRAALGLLGGVGVGVLATACAAEPRDEMPRPGSSNEIPEETAGPYPGDGSNGANVLSESGVVRSDITGSFGGPTGVADGVPLTLELTLLDVSGDSSGPLAGAAVYLWHCDADGQYSLYSDAVVDENFLRGVQESDADGTLRFTTIFPGCYSGRWPHAHFEVYPSLAKATGAENKMRTSQLALPAEVAEVVYADSRYAGSAENLARTSLDSDMVFADGYSLQMAKVTGSNEEGYVARLTVPV